MMTLKRKLRRIRENKDGPEQKFTDIPTEYLN